MHPLIVRPTAPRDAVVALGREPYRAAAEAMTIRRAAAGDAGEVAALLGESFRPQDLDLTIYGCAGIVAYLQMEFALPRAYARSMYLVAAIAGRIAGYIEMRKRESGPLLNYIATGRAWRGAGIARTLLEAALREAHPPAGAEFTLDVFEHNRPALEWYRRRGFRSLGRTAFWRVPANPAGGAASAVRILDLPQADAAHRAFGFSSFRLAHGGRTFTVGRLGERWFRVTEGEVLGRAEALGALASIDPRREILFCGAAEAIPADRREGCSPLLWSIHMGRSLPLVADTTC